jgi:F-type H+-transporting ATPase subunit delta
MIATKQTKREARQLFRLCCVNGSFDQSRVRQVVERVIQARNRGYLALLTEFERRVKLASAEHTAQVETAVPLPSDLRKTVQARLEKAYGLAIEIQFTERKELIGGMRIKVGSDVYDGSVLAELAKLEKQF